jgi:DNA helicase-2/ATP-dependent DNA helicase PcrA
MDDEVLRLSTVHQAKGLEFKVVFVMWLADGMFPSSKSLQNPANEEEERRLFYVSVTRAKDYLFLIYPLIRNTAGYYGDVFQRPSRFILELPEHCFERVELPEKTWAWQ